MKITKTLKSFSAAAAILLIGAGCASDKITDNSFTIENKAVAMEILKTDFTEDTQLKLEPNKILISESFSKVFVLRKIDTEINEEGLLVARVFGRTEFEGWFTWIYKAESPYRIAYRFVWFDGNGKLIDAKLDPKMKMRENLPGDMVRFSDVAPTEECKMFSICLDVLN